jgi:hypothetical protein
MGKVNVAWQNLLTGIAGAGSGYLAGQQRADEELERRMQEAQQNLLAGRVQKLHEAGLLSQFQQQQDSTLLGLDLDPESRARVVGGIVGRPNPLVGLLGSLGSLPAVTKADVRGRTFDPGLHFRRGYETGAPQPTGPVPIPGAAPAAGMLTPGVAPVAAPGGPTVDVPGVGAVRLNDPHRKTALAGLRQRVASAYTEAGLGNNRPLQQQLGTVLTQIDSAPDKVDLAALDQQVNGFVGQLGAKTAADRFGKQLAAAQAWIDKRLEQGMVRDRFLDEANALSGDLATVDTSTPQGLAAARKLLGAYQRLRRRPIIQPSAQSRHNSLVLEEKARQDAITGNDRYADNLRSAIASGQPDAVVGAIGQAFSHARQNARHGVRPPLDAKFDPEPQMVQGSMPVPVGELAGAALEGMLPPGVAQAAAAGARALPPASAPVPRKETQQEAEARVFRHVGELTRDRRYLQVAQGRLFSLLRPEVWNSLTEATQNAVLEQLAELAPPGQPGILPKVYRTRKFTPYQERVLEQGDQRLKIAKENAALHERSVKVAEGNAARALQDPRTSAAQKERITTARDELQALNKQIEEVAPLAGFTDKGQDNLDLLRRQATKKAAELNQLINGLEAGAAGGGTSKGGSPRDKFIARMIQNGYSRADAERKAGLAGFK